MAFSVFGRPALTWNEKDCRSNTLIEAVNLDPDLCLLAGPCEYLHYINEYYQGRTVHFLSSQPMTWRWYTEKWLKIYVANPYDIIYTNSSQEKLTYLREGDYLVDDSPCFGDYSKIILVDYPYNRRINAPIRVRNREELREVIERLEWRKYQ